METKTIAQLVSDVRSGINRFLIRELSHRGIDGLAPSHGAILFHLFNHGPATMKDLARAIRRDKSTVTALVGKLTRSGYLVKQAHHDDQRSTVIELTRKSEALKPVFRDISEKMLRQAWRGIPTEEQKEVVAVLKKIRANF